MGGNLRRGSLYFCGRLFPKIGDFVQCLACLRRKCPWTPTNQLVIFVVSEMTYTVSSGTLNSSIPYHTIPGNLRLNLFAQRSSRKTFVLLLNQYFLQARCHSCRPANVQAPRTLRGTEHTATRHFSDITVYLKSVYLARLTICVCWFAVQLTTVKSCHWHRASSSSDEQEMKIATDW